MRATPLVLAILVFSQVVQAEVQETPHLRFAAEFVRELAAVERIRSAAETETKAADVQGKMTSCVATATSMQLELRSQASIMKQMRLNPPYDFLPTGLAGFYEKKIALFGSLSDICAVFIGGERPNVDYQKPATELPKVRATLDYVDHAIFQTSEGVFATLISDRPDKDNHTSHMTITRAERDALVDQIDRAFGPALKKESQNWFVSSASVIRRQLQTFKCSDDPW